MNVCGKENREKNEHFTILQINQRHEFEDTPGKGPPYPNPGNNAGLTGRQAG